VTPDLLTVQLIRAATGIAAKKRIGHLIYVSDQELPEKLLKPSVKRKIVNVVSAPQHRDQIEADGDRAVLTPGYEMGRQERFRLALVAAYARGYVREREIVVGLVGRQPRAFPDTLLLARVDRDIVEVSDAGETVDGATGIQPSVFDAIVELAVHLGIEGWEGHALGTLFVLGDTAHVMERSRQLALNPFQGYSEAERNIADPNVQHALRAFATLDGAFVVREDGVVLAAGRYIEFQGSADIKVPLGLGARHVAAAAVSAATEALAIVVSQSTGKVRVFRHGRVMLEITPTHRRT
jgi:DNA integrity scanning protein DisA with diadenylate cyclase activity